MFWNKTDVCGYLDENGNFYKKRSDRDEANKNIKRNQLKYSFQHRLGISMDNFYSSQSRLDNFSLQEKQVLEIFDRFLQVNPNLLEHYIALQARLKEIDEE